jgi:hypothetical protein
LTDETLDAAAVPFVGHNGAELLDGIAEALAAHLRFQSHGPLTDDERVAFTHGFRHGIHQLVGLVAQAAAISEQAKETIDRLVAEAVTTWDLGICVKILTLPTSEPDVTH